MMMLLGAVAIIWIGGVARLWWAAGAGRGVSWRQAACALLALVVLAVALLPPFDRVADTSFSMHMVQHLLLVAVVAPLLVLGSPVVSLLWALPPRYRQATVRWFVPHLAAFRMRRSAPLWAFLLHTVTMWCWHLPAAYDAALRSPVLHALEHAGFLGTSMLLWWVALRPEPGRSPRYATGFTLMFATAVQGTLLGAVLFFASRPWYAAATGTAALTSLPEQQLAGLIMWVPGGLVYLAASAWFAFRWMRAPGRALPVPLLVAVVTGCIVMAGACRPSAPAVMVAGGNPARGRVALAGFGCGSCHEIHGVQSAHGRVGPPLDGLATRSFIAGQVPNTADNLVRWIRDPQAIEPGTAMPNLQVGVHTARDMAAYLYTLR